MTDLREPQPYEILKAALDEAHTNFIEKLNNITRNVNHKDGPLFLLMDIEELYAARAVLDSRTQAFAREYAHMAEVNAKVMAQRDEANRRFESLKRTIKQFDLDDDPPTSPLTPNKGRKRKK